jgi:predicted lipid-binding transport protein (Tim44 family)
LEKKGTVFMQKLLLIFFTILISGGLIINDAQAKRFGGGRSFGMTRDTSSFSRMGTHSSRVQSTALPQQRPTSNASRWLGPLAGLAIGGLLGSLFMSHGLGSGILSWLLIGGIIFLAWTFIRSRMAPAVQPAYSDQTANFQAAPIHASNVISLPQHSFDETTFLRQAKASFIRLQAAYDTKNLADLREFTAPEVFAEIQLQLQERGEAANQTEVISIEAELLDLNQEHQTTTVSVLFSGYIREEAGAAPVLVKEIWHFRKENLNTHWTVAGIQQA